MRRLAPLAAVLIAACRATAPDSAAPSFEGPVVEIRESFACPLPASRGLVTVARDGKAERVVFEGLDFELGKTKSTREQMTLAPNDAADLFRLVADSGWRGMPERPDEFALHGRPSCADCCSGALYIKTAEGGRSLSFAADRKPAELEALMKAIDGVLARGVWTRVVYPWENQR
ncbi:MAG: hypothetical protein PHS14_02215 [Elusimicrobia bacterium]|nr:hypothetical protein [Elusimicrobiota bacterium]